MSPRPLPSLTALTFGTWCTGGLLGAVDLLGAAACSSETPAPPPPLFEALPPDTTGVTFANAIPTSDSFSILHYEYIYNGGGVGVGDFDRDGLPDLYFSGNLRSGALYLQRDTLRFTDVTAASGTTADVWTSGVNVADVNGDGWDDLYLSTLNLLGTRDTPNRLYLNRGLDADFVPVFEEVAAEVGLADVGYGTHSTWFDLEGDGDLDLYVLNNAIEDYSRNVPRGTDTSGTAASVDRVYENVSAGGDLRFELRPDLVRAEGWGLGIVAQDFDGDGDVEIYVGNDFLSDDLHWEVNSTGTLAEQDRDRFTHTSYNAMGVDAGDINGDGAPELVTVDMLPDDNRRRKTMFAETGVESDRVTAQRGYRKQYVRNTFQLNDGRGRFVDIALHTGTAATDWSWSPLLADVDNDGDRDFLVTNGYPKDITNRDFTDYASRATQFGTPEAQLTKLNDALEHVAGVHQANYLFANLGDLRFADSSAVWLGDAPSYSNGAVFVDLDLDGDLDLVTNNIDEPAGVYRNRLRETAPDRSRYLRITLAGPPGNPDGIGAKLYLSAGDSLRHYVEHVRQRGYLSTTPADVHVGLGSLRHADSLLLVWPDGRRERLSGIPANSHLTLSYADAVSTPYTLPLWARPPTPTLVESATPSSPEHRESDYTDFDVYALQVRDLSRLGPSLLNVPSPDSSSELILVGGASGEPTRVYRYAENRFTEVQRLAGDPVRETVALCGVDIDGDGDLDVIDGSGSNELASRPGLLSDLVYENVDGTFVLRDSLSHPSPTFTSVITAADVDGDGDEDLFVGARTAPGAYPSAAPSLLYENDGGTFGKPVHLLTDRVTDAVWGNFGGDSAPDLITVGDWAAPQLWINRGGDLQAPTELPVDAGWYYSATAGDLDGDGDADLLLGNYGTNGTYRADSLHPLRLRVDDYDGNGAADPILTMFDGEVAYPTHPRNTLTRQLPSFRQRIPSYADYAGWTDAELPPVSERGGVFEVRELRSYYLENVGDGQFIPHALPPLAQLAPIQAALLLPPGARAGSPSRPALLAVQNDYATEPLGGRMDAGTGFLMWIDERGVPRVDAHYWGVRTDARDLVKVADGVLVASNNSEVAVFHKRKRGSR